MDQILQYLPGTACYIDDVIIASENYEQCLEQVQEVLKCLSKHSVKMNSKKCKFFQQRFTYIGHEIDEHGLHPTSEKVEAIRKALKPSNVTQ